MTKFFLLIFLFTQTKSPTKAAWMSAFVPGLGQIYTGNYLKGIIFFLGEIYFISELIKTYPKIDKDKNSLYKFSFNFIISISLWSYNIADAYVSAHLYNFESDTSLAK